MAADKFPSITTSALSNNSQETVILSILGPGAATRPHYHSDVAKSFSLVSSCLFLFTSPDGKEDTLQEHKLEVGASLTVPIGQVYAFKAGDVESKVTTTFEPGA